MKLSIMSVYNFTEESIWEETDEYLRLNRKTFGLPVDLLIDEVGMYKYCNHPLVIFFRNSYDSNEHNYVPVSVSENPRIVFKKDINLYRIDVQKIFNWIRRYREYIRRMALGVIQYKDLYSVAAINPRKSYVNESYTLQIPLYEMAVINPEESGLNWKIWLDEDQLYLKGGHAMRIKIQDRKNNGDTRTWIPLKIDDSTFPKGVKQNYSHSDKCSFDAFINANYDAIRDLADKKIKLEEFQDNMMKVYKISGSKWKAVPAKKHIVEPDYKIAFSLNDEYDVVYSKEGYNILDPDGELLLDEWCMDVDHDIYSDIIDGVRKIYFVIYSFNDKMYKIYPDDYRMIEI